MTENRLNFLVGSVLFFGGADSFHHTLAVPDICARLGRGTSVYRGANPPFLHLPLAAVGRVALGEGGYGEIVGKTGRAYML